MTCPPACGPPLGFTVNQLMFHKPEIAGGDGDALGDGLGDALGEALGEADGEGLGLPVPIPLKR